MNEKSCRKVRGRLNPVKTSKGFPPPLPYYCWTRWGEDHQRVLRMPQRTRPHQFCWWGFFLRIYGRAEITQTISRNDFTEFIIYDLSPKVNTTTIYGLIRGTYRNPPLLDAYIWVPLIRGCVFGLALIYWFHKRGWKRFLPLHIQTLTLLGFKPQPKREK